jgi:hypothetical protein
MIELHLRLTLLEFEEGGCDKMENLLKIILKAVLAANSEDYLEPIL